MDGLKALDYALHLSADYRERSELDHSPGHTRARATLLQLSVDHSERVTGARQPERA